MPVKMIKKVFAANVETEKTDLVIEYTVQGDKAVLFPPAVGSEKEVLDRCSVEHTSTKILRVLKPLSRQTFPKIDWSAGSQR